MKMTKSLWAGLLIGGLVSFLVAMAFYTEFHAPISFIIVPIGMIMGVAPQLMKPPEDE